MEIIYRGVKRMEDLVFEVIWIFCPDGNGLYNETAKKNRSIFTSEEEVGEWLEDMWDRIGAGFFSVIGLTRG